MATNQILVKDAVAAAVAQISIATHASYAPGDDHEIELVSPVTTMVEVELDLWNRLDTLAEQSAQADFGPVRASRYVCTCCIEYQLADPTTGTVVGFYWAASSHATAAEGNPGYTTGVVGEYSGGPATLAEGLDQLKYIGSLIVSADQDKQIMDVGILAPTQRYGSLIVVNETGGTICDTDIDESAVVLTPIVDDIAAAA